MPGTRLGFVEGCSMEDISDLTTELSLLHASEMHCTQTASHEQRDADSLRGTEQGTVLHLAVACENADGNLDKWVPGTQAHNNHRSRIEKIVQQQLEAIRHADPLRQKDLMIQQESSLNSLLLVLEAAGLHPADAQPSENFGVTGDGKQVWPQDSFWKACKAQANAVLDASVPEAACKLECNHSCAMLVGHCTTQIVMPLSLSYVSSGCLVI
jgi:hypothetical protein